MHTAKKLLERGDEVLGIDNINDYYDVSLKKNRLKYLTEFKNFSFIHLDLCDEEIFSIFQDFKTDNVINLGAQAGVRFSLTNPKAYIDSNIYGFLNILEACRKFDVKHLVYASSSSVYGANKSYPYHENSSTDHQVSLYAATKKSNELMAHVYSYNYGIPSTGLRFFTVYGPWGRPDMAGMIFIESILSKKPIKFLTMEICIEILHILMMLLMESSKSMTKSHQKTKNLIIKIQHLVPVHVDLKYLILETLPREINRFYKYN